MQTPDFGVASEPVSVLGGTADSDSADELGRKTLQQINGMKPGGSGAAAASHVSQIPISGCVEPDISDDFGIQKDNELQSKLSAPSADAVMTKPPAAEQSKKNVKSDKDELAKEVRLLICLRLLTGVKPVIRRLICVRRRQSLNRLLMCLG